MSKRNNELDLENVDMMLEEEKPKKTKRTRKAKVDPEHENFNYGKKKFKKEKSDIEPVLGDFDITGDNLESFRIMDFLNDNNILKDIHLMKQDYNEDIDMDNEDELINSSRVNLDNLIDKTFTNVQEFVIYLDMEHPKIYKNTIKLTDNNEMTYKRLFRVLSYSARDILKEMKQKELEFEPMDRLNEMSIEYITVNRENCEILVQFRGFYPDIGMDTFIL